MASRPSMKKSNFQLAINAAQTPEQLEGPSQKVDQNQTVTSNQNERNFESNNTVVTSHNTLSNKTLPPLKKDKNSQSGSSLKDNFLRPEASHGKSLYNIQEVSDLWESNQSIAMQDSRYEAADAISEQPQESRFSSNRSIEDYPIVYKTYKELVEQFMTCASLCHENVVDKDISGLHYLGPSPDDIAICKGLDQIGISYLGKNSDDQITVKFKGQEKTFHLKMVCLINPAFSFRLGSKKTVCGCGTPRQLYSIRQRSRQ